uniref:Uncharacterized protein n=1 Tax=Panagrellus redivivus TaxID=6233 RepID=A0A7E4ZXY4_PANRE
MFLFNVLKTGKKAKKPSKSSKSSAPKPENATIGDLMAAVKKQRASKKLERDAAAKALLAPTVAKQDTDRLCVGQPLSAKRPTSLKVPLQSSHPSTTSPTTHLPSRSQKSNKF